MVEELRLPTGSCGREVTPDRRLQLVKLPFEVLHEMHIGSAKDRR